MDGSTQNKGTPWIGIAIIVIAIVVTVLLSGGFVWLYYTQQVSEFESEVQYPLEYDVALRDAVFDPELRLRETVIEDLDGIAFKDGSVLLNRRFSIKCITRAGAICYLAVVGSLAENSTVQVRTDFRVDVTPPPWTAIRYYTFTDATRVSNGTLLVSAEKGPFWENFPSGIFALLWIGSILICLIVAMLWFPVPTSASAPE